MNDDRSADEIPASDADDSAFEGSEFFARLQQHAGDLVSQIGALIQIQIDRRRLEVRRMIVRAALVSIFALPAAILIGVSAWRVSAGLAGGFAEWFGGRAWAGDLAAGALVLLAVALGAAFAIASGARRSLEEKAAKYEAHRLDERLEHRHEHDDSAPVANGSATARPAGEARAPRNGFHARVPR